MLSIAACADPIREAAWVIGKADEVAPETVDDPAELHALGASLTAVWAFDLSWPHLCTAVERLREQGRLGLLGEALTSQAWAAIHLGKPRAAATAAAEAGRLSRDTGRPRWALIADLAIAMLAGEHGDHETANTLVSATEAELLSIGAQVDPRFRPVRPGPVRSRRQPARRRVRTTGQGAGPDRYRPPPVRGLLGHRRADRDSGPHRPRRRSATISGAVGRLG
ncbi:hypothetical protein [Catenulispora subtropica]|uniref:hypothetical protein n=1 Tax=Catenulispora subtropica TaxID=450798 RepID=UPI0031DBB9DC